MRQSITKTYQVDLELSKDIRNEIKQSIGTDTINTTHRWLSNLITEALPSTKGIGEIVITESGRYLGLEF